MKLKNIVNKKYKKLESEEEYILSGDIRLFDIEIDKIKETIITAIDENDKVIGRIKKELLEYLMLRRTDLFLSSVTEVLEEGLVAVDKDGRIFFVNSSYSKILGVPLYKILGKYIQDIESSASIIKVLKTKEPFQSKYNYIKSVDKYVNVKITPIFREGKFKGAFSIFTDVTELNHLNKEVSRISEVAEEYNRRLEAQEKLKELEVIGQSTNYLNVISKALTVSKTDASVIILGENGSGKDIISKLIHKNSKRKDEVFITLNCAAIPENLIESEMFGYEEGSFTGAQQGGKLGKFELAKNGTIFLDEVGDMSMAMQSKLLRTLETGQIEKIGRQGNIDIDVRVIAATNQDLEKKIEEGSFREDLYYRLNVVNLTVPPLRERSHDIILFIDHFLNKYNNKYNKDLIVSSEVYNALARYSWPGNVRELKNCIEHGVILSSGKRIEIENLPSKFLLRKSKNDLSKLGNRSLEELLNEKEKEIILDKLDEFNWDRLKVQENLKLSERTFYRRLNKHDIELP